MQYYIIIPISILVLIHLIPYDTFDRFENFINIIRGACILTTISCIILFIISII